MAVLTAWLLVGSALGIYSVASAPRSWVVAVTLTTAWLGVLWWSARHRAVVFFEQSASLVLLLTLIGLGIALLRGPAPVAPAGLERSRARDLTASVAGPVRRQSEGWTLRVTPDRFPGDVRLWMARRPPPQTRPGSLIRARVTLRPVREVSNPGVRHPASVLLARGIVATGRAERLELVVGSEPGAVGVRERFRDVVDAGLSSRAARLVQAIVLGDGGAVRPEHREAWRSSGLAHLLAISGLHVGLVAWFVFRLAVGLGALLSSGYRSPGRVAGVFAALAAWAYTDVAGYPLSAVRASTAVTVVLVATALRRGPDMVTAICVALVVIVVADPLALLDPACRLSFGAVLALAVAMPGVQRRLEEQPRLVRWLATSFAASLVCTLGTLPALAWHYGTVPLAGLVANPIAIPLVGFGLVVPAVGSLGLELLGVPAPMWLLEVGATLSWSLVEAAATLCDPVDTRGLTAGGIALACVGVSLLLAAIAVPADGPTRFVRTPRIWDRIRNGHRIRNVRGTRRDGADRGRWLRSRIRTAGPALVGVLLLVAAWAGARVPHGASDELRITFLAVGHGDAIVAQLPGGHTLLVDGGGSPTGRFDVGGRTVIPALRALGVTSIDVLAVSHAHPDHFEGLFSVLDALPVDEVWIPPGQSAGRGPASGAWPRFLAHADARSATVRVVRPAHHELGDVAIEVLHPYETRAGPDALNDNSLVLRLVFGDFSVLLTGDVERAGEAALLASGRTLRSTVLKAPHHGSRTSSAAAFLAAVRPQLAVAQAEDGGRFGLPAPQIEARYRALGIPLWITGRHGALQVRSDGRRWWTLKY